MATYTVYSPPGVSLTATGTAQLYKLGSSVAGFDADLGPAEFVYARGSNAAAGNLVYFIPAVTAGQVRQHATASQASAGALGVAMGALSATNVFGWVMVKGFFDSASLEAQCAAGIHLKPGTDAGKFQSRTATNDGYGIQAVNVVSVNNSTNAGTVFIHYPFNRAGL